MPLRKTKVASVKFTLPKESLSDQEEKTRKRRFTNDFCMLCPYSLTLTGSTLETQIVESSPGITLEFWLQETTQSNLAVTSTTKTKPVGAGDDCYANDVTKLVEEIHQAKQVVRTAINPALSIDELRQPGLLGDRIRAIRRRLRQRTLLRIPSADGKLLDFDYTSSKYLPRSTIANISANVSAMFTNVAELSSSKYLGEVPEALQNVFLPERILMSRPSAKKNPTLVKKLTSAMDAKKSVMLKVAVSLDWIDAKPVALGFITQLSKVPKVQQKPIQMALVLQSPEN
jgi:hypothetical protein